MTELQRLKPPSLMLQWGNKLARKILRKLFRVRAEESFTRNAYKAPFRYFRGCARLLKNWSTTPNRFLERRRAKRPITNTLWPLDRPLVSVIIPCSNDDRYLKDALHSVLNSTWQDLEVILIADGSTDESSPAMVPSREGGKVRCLYQSRHRDVWGKRCFGLHHVRGKYILFLDADDLIDPSYLENAVYLLETTGVDAIVPDVRPFSNSQELGAAYHRRTGTVLHSVGLSVLEMLEGHSAPNTSLFRYSFWEDNQIEPSTIHSPMTDWDFWMRWASCGIRYIHLSEPYHLERQHSKTWDKPVRLPACTDRQPQRPKVRHPFVNLNSRSLDLPHGELNILVCVPWFDNYGSSVLLGNIFRSMAKSGVVATVLGTNAETDPACLEGVGRYRVFTKDCFYLATCLPEGSKPDFLAYIVRSRKIDVVMINGSRMTYETLGRLRRENPKLRVVDHLYNTEGHIGNNREFATQIDYNIVVNEDVRAELIRRGESPERIRVIASGIDIDRFPPGRFDHPACRGEPLTFGYLGRLSEEKRPLDVVEMACRFPFVRFIMAGEGPMRSQIEDAIRQADIGDRIQLLGYRPALEVFEMIDALLVPSRVEGLPNVLLEAMVLRKPSIATRVGMIPQVIEDGVNGFLYAAGDLEALADKIRAVSALTPESWLALGCKARAKVIQDHNLAVCAAEYLETFRNLVGRIPRSSLRSPD